MGINGWKLSLALVSKHLGNLGDQVAGMIAGFDPVTATEVDRDRLNEKLGEVALRLATARRDYERENTELQTLVAQVAKDQKAAQVLIDKYNAKQIDEATLKAFTDELEDEQKRLPGEQADVAAAQETVDTIQSVMNDLQAKIDAFDAHAKQALRDIAQAQAEKERADLRLQQQKELTGITSGIQDSSTALGALAKKAEQMRVQADAANILVQSGQRGVDRIDAIAAARKAAEGADTSGESPVDRLRRIAGAGADKAA